MQGWHECGAFLSLWHHKMVMWVVKAIKRAIIKHITVSQRDDGWSFVKEGIDSRRGAGSIIHNQRTLHQLCHQQAFQKVKLWPAEVIIRHCRDRPSFLQDPANPRAAAFPYHHTTTLHDLVATQNNKLTISLNANRPTTSPT